MATKNDTAWETLFNRYAILDAINRHGFYEIESQIINTVRESRLMAKFDHYVNLPHIFKQNNLSILPISRTKYVIGRFDTYKDVKYSDKIDPVQVSFPYYLESIDYTDLYSESSALHCAYVSGIIDQVTGEKMIQTVSGRMSSASFGFNIRNIVDGSSYPVTVENSQLEIDAGYEGSNSFLIIEAKNFSVEDFLIRQLYYPYRLWKSKLNKRVIPALMTYSNDVFSFFIYDFIDQNEYRSLVLKEQKSFIIADERIELSDLIDIYKDTEIVTEPEIPFPQADKFERVVDLLGLLVQNDLTKEQITQNYQFDIRQTDYYTNSAIYLGLVQKYRDSETKEITYTLTPAGRSIMNKKHKAKFMSLAVAILRHEVFNKVFLVYLDTGILPDIEAICSIMKTCSIYNVNQNSSTIPRRAQTVSGWMNWLLRLR